jgi:parvulin-like peptidyl-prolyl isomerase
VKRILPLLLALLLLAPSCGGDQDRAVEVNGERIADSQVTDELEAIKGNTAYVDAIEQSSEGVRVIGSAPNSFDSGFVARILTRQIIYELVQQEVARRKLEVDDTAISRARQDLEQQIPANILQKFPKDYLSLITRWNAAALVLQGDLVDLPASTGDAAQKYFEDHPKDFEQACASHILVETEQQAREVRAELAQGADFATLAKQRSLDTGSAQQGGKLPCSFRGTNQPEFEKAAFSQKVGGIGQPVQTVFGWHIIRVNDRKVPKYADVADEVSTRLQNLSAERFNTWLQKAVKDAKIDLNPRYGSWDETSGQVTAPDGPTTTTGQLPGGPSPTATTPGTSATPGG